jgi:hypothetical protein
MVPAASRCPRGSANRSRLRRRTSRNANVIPRSTAWAKGDGRPAGRMGYNSACGPRAAARGALPGCVAAGGGGAAAGAPGEPSGLGRALPDPRRNPGAHELEGACFRAGGHRGPSARRARARRLDRAHRGVPGLRRATRPAQQESGAETRGDRTRPRVHAQALATAKLVSRRPLCSCARRGYLRGAW